MIYSYRDYIKAIIKNIPILHLGNVCPISIWCMGSQISRIFTDSLAWFFYFLFSGWPVNARWEYFRWLPNTVVLPPTFFTFYFILFLNHHCLFILRSERDWCFSYCSEYIFPIFGLVLCKSFNWFASQDGWLVSLWHMVYTGFTWYI